MGSGNTPRPPGQSAESASGNTAAVEAGGSGMLSVELAAALARYQRALLGRRWRRHRGPSTPRRSAEMPRAGRDPNLTPGPALDVVPRGAEVRPARLCQMRMDGWSCRHRCADRRNQTSSRN